MRENRFHKKTPFRGGKKVLDTEREITITLIETRIPKGRLRLQKWLIVFLLLLLTSLIVINSYSIAQFQNIRYGTITKENIQENYVHLKDPYKPIDSGGFLVYNKGCRIPAMDPMDPAIQRFLTKEQPFVCESGNSPSLVESNNTAIFINFTVLNEFYNKSDVNCCWQPFWRKTDQDNDVIYDEKCYPFQDSCTINAEFIRVECSYKNKVIYKDYHAFLPSKPWVEKRCRQALNKNPIVSSDRLSVLIVGLDSISRLNFHRMMPKTVKALQSLDAVEMLGYTKVADNTYPNLIPVLAGLNKDELHDLCWQKPDKTFDECPFLWKKFSAAGYRTVFGEDACNMTTFNYLKPGFQAQPTDYYLRPYCIGAERDIGNTCKLNANLCIGTRKTFDCLLHYTRKTAREFSSKLYFAFFWQASLTHDFFTYPQLGDDSYHDFIEYLSQEDLLNRTVLIMMSDHGMRWGEFRQTYQGRTEDSLPFVFIVLPQWWRIKYPLAWSNLRKNTRSLTTAFDLHETLIDLLNPRVLRESFLKKRIKTQTVSPVPRGISWFLKIPNDRTCDTAQIASHWCMCHTSNNISLNDTGVQDSVSFLVGELNAMISRYPSCASLNLHEIKDAQVWLDKADGAILMDYTVTIQTVPGNAVFESTVRYRTDDNSHKLVGSVSRLNAYGKQSACIDEFTMRLYCYCL